ncbi:hypothetical protein DD750_04030 [Helicobacter pylori]|nr:hypothetical protein DD750_04030 [Helicobacter pylori]
MFSQIFKIFGTYRVESNAFLVRLGSHSELFYKLPITLKLIANQLPPFLGVKFRVKTPLTLFCFLNILVFPAF